MKEMYRRGMTLCEIGDVFGVTRERVRQVIKRYFGLDREHGGQAIKSLLSVRDRVEKLAAEDEKRQRRYMAKWGMTKEECIAVSDLPRSDNRHPIRRFECQRKSAKVRGIEWRMTFKEWWTIWQESGHWHERGRGKGYCMARYGDTGPYSADNVEIITIGQNFRDSYLKTSWDERFPNARKPKTSVSFARLTRLGNFLGWQVYFNKKYIATVPVRK